VELIAYHLDLESSCQTHAIKWLKLLKIILHTWIDAGGTTPAMINDGQMGGYFCYNQLNRFFF